jgi:hypothetical protein
MINLQSKWISHSKTNYTTYIAFKPPSDFFCGYQISRVIKTDYCELSSTEFAKHCLALPMNCAIILFPFSPAIIWYTRYIINTLGDVSAGTLLSSCTPISGYNYKPYASTQVSVGVTKSAPISWASARFSEFSESVHAWRHLAALYCGVRSTYIIKIATPAAVRTRGELICRSDFIFINSSPRNDMVFQPVS